MSDTFEEEKEGENDAEVDDNAGVLQLIQEIVFWLIPQWPSVAP
jgi:hypothetical protein